MTATKQMTEGFVENNGIRLHYVDWGNPTQPHLFLVHGWDGNAHYWDLVAPAFGERFHVVAVTLRGRGKSDEDPTGEYHFDSYLGDLLQVTEKIGLRRMIFVGASLGGMIALSYTVRHPEQIEKLVLVDIGGQLGGDHPSSYDLGRQNAPDRFKSLQEAEAWFRQWSYYEKMSPEGMKIILREHFKKTPDGLWTWIYGHRLRKLRAERPKEYLFPKQWHALSKIFRPVLIIRGGRSEALLREVAERTQRELANATLVEIADCSHFPFLEVPEKFIKALAEFI